MKTANILDPTHDTLDPAVFDGTEEDRPRLKSTVSQWVKSQIYSVLITNGIEDPASQTGLALTGSLCTYQWSDVSDFDVSLWVKIPLEDFDRAQWVSFVVENIDGKMVPGTTHPLQTFVVNKEQVHEFSDIYKPGLRSAWDMDRNEWIVPPERSRTHDVQSEYPDLFRRGKQFAAKMELLLKYNPASATAYWNYIHKMRREHMKAGLGDYAESNIMYKMLANSGLFPKIEETTGEHIASAGEGCSKCGKSPVDWVCNEIDQIPIAGGGSIYPTDWNYISCGKKYCNQCYMDTQEDTADVSEFDLVPEAKIEQSYYHHEGKAGMRHWMTPIRRDITGG